MIEFKHKMNLITNKWERSLFVIQFTFLLKFGGDKPILTC